MGGEIMADNRLFLVAPSGERLCIAKSSGGSWYAAPEFQTRLDYFLKGKDLVAADGSDKTAKTELRLMTENEIN